MLEECACAVPTFVALRIDRSNRRNTARGDNNVTQWWIIYRSLLTPRSTIAEINVGLRKLSVARRENFDFVLLRLHMSANYFKQLRSLQFHQSEFSTDVRGLCDDGDQRSGKLSDRIDDAAVMMQPQGIATCSRYYELFSREKRSNEDEEGNKVR